MHDRFEVSARMSIVIRMITMSTSHLAVTLQYLAIFILHTVIIQYPPPISTRIEGSQYRVFDLKFTFLFYTQIMLL